MRGDAYAKNNNVATRALGVTAGSAARSCAGNSNRRDLCAAQCMCAVTVCDVGREHYVVEDIEKPLGSLSVS